MLSPHSRSRDTFTLMQRFGVLAGNRQATPLHLACAKCCISLVLACGTLCLPALAGSPLAAASAGFYGAAASQPAPPSMAHAPFIDQDALAYEGTEGDSDRYNWRSEPPDTPDWPGVGRDVGYFLGYQFAAIAVLYVAPESISGWDREQKENYSFDKWRNNVSQPVWDQDRWWINYMLHPYWGGAYYVQARERGLDRTQAFLYSALLSTLFEYGAEALAEPVSAQDLVVTPVVGTLVGEYLLMPLRARILAKPGKLTWGDKALLFATNPLGVMSAETDRMLGVNTTLQWRPIGMRLPATGMDASAAALPATLRAQAPIWGLQFRADW